MLVRGSGAGGPSFANEVEATATAQLRDACEAGYSQARSVGKQTKVGAIRRR